MKLRYLCVWVLLSAAVVLAQERPAAHSCTLRLEVLSPEGGHVAGALRVQLFNRGIPVGMRFTDGSGLAEFSGLPPGEYHAQVSGEGYESADTGSIDIDDWTVILSKTVVLHRKTDESTQAGGTPTVSVSDLNVPPKAAKEYKRGNEEMAVRHWDKAIDHFKKAIEIAPRFPAAYNNLAVCYGQLGDKGQEREALQKAISFDSRSVMALVNLARLSLDDNKPSDAMSLLSRALVVDPINAEALSLLVDAEYAGGRYEEAVAHARRVHGLPHGDYAGVHYTAARAYERLGRLSDAVAELRLYLQEQPTGPRAEFVRKTLPALERQASISSPQQ